MQERNQDPSKQKDQADYNPTGRNFDQENVSGAPESINNVNQQRSEEERIDDNDPPLTEQDLEETGLSGEEADQVAWDAPDDSPRDDNRRDDTTKAPGK